MNSNLPPGVTNQDIDEQAGCYVSCDECGRQFVTDDPEQSLCPRCQYADDQTGGADHV